jgi:hypothetical protein
MLAVDYLAYSEIQHLQHALVEDYVLGLKVVVDNGWHL